MNREDGGSFILILMMLVGGLFYMQVPGSGEKGAGASHENHPTANSTPAETRTSVDRCHQDAGSLLRDLVDDATTSSADRLMAADSPVPLDLEAERIHDIRATVERAGLPVEFLIATVPDPIDSHVGWQFDGQVAAIQRAIEKGWHFPDRFFLPWACAKRAPEGSDIRTLHQRTPGVMLFRARDHVLVLFLIGESPTTGVHKIALEHALQFIQFWAGESQSASAEPLTPMRPDWQPFRIIGPTFSGSLASLREAIWHWWDGHCRGQDPEPLCNFDIVSGTSTASWFARALTRAPQGGCGGQIVYRTTVIRDDARNAALSKYLDLLGESAAAGSASGGRVAILYETGTAFGQLTAKPLKPAGDAFCASAEEVEKIKASSPQLTPPRATLWLPFPLHISRVRAEEDQLHHAQSTPVEEVGGFKRPELELSLDEDEQSIDVMPSMAPSLTAASDELALSQILSTIAIEGTHYVGILATDVRDTLFLARQVRKYSPDVQLFIYESDSLFTHPDYNAELEGSFVFSTYPLFSSNQRWSFPYQRDGLRLQFSAERTEGVYNAVIAQLQKFYAHRYQPPAAPMRDEKSQRDDKEAASPPPDNNLYPLEYSLPYWSPRSPTQAVTQPVTVTPPLWISVVGKGAMWPVAFFTVDQLLAGAASSLSSPTSGVANAATVSDSASSNPPTDLMYEQPYTSHEPRDAMNEWGFCDAVFLLLILLSFGHWRLYREARTPPQPNDGYPSPWQRVVSVFRASACPECHRGQQVGTLLSLYAVIALDACFFAVYRIDVTWDRTRQLFLVVFGALALFLLTWTAIEVIYEGWQRSYPTDVGGRPCGHQAPEAPTAWWWLLLMLSLIVTLFISATLIVLLPGEFPRLLVARALTFGSGLSPLSVALFLGSGIYLGGIALLRQVHVVDSGVAGTPFDETDELRGSASESSRLSTLTRKVRLAVQNPWQAVSPSTLVVAGLILWILPSAGLELRMLPTFENFWIDKLLKVVGLLYIGIVLLAFIQLVGLWAHVRRLLRRLATHPLLPAFGRLPSQASIGGGGLWGSLAGPADKDLALEQLRLLFNHLRRPHVQEQLTALVGVDTRVPETIKDRSQFLVEAGKRFGMMLVQLWQASPLSGAVASNAADAVKVVECEPDTLPLYTTWNVASDLGIWLRLVEEHVALQMAFFLNQQLVHIRNLLGFITAAILLFVLAINSYPFQPRGLLSLYAMSVFAAAVVAAATVMVQIGKDPVLSRIAGTTPNKLDRTIILPVLTYAVLPFIGLVATQFPELSGIFSGAQHALRVLH